MLRALGGVSFGDCFGLRIVACNAPSFVFAHYYGTRGLASSWRGAATRDQHTVSAIAPKFVRFILSIKGWVGAP